MAPYFNFVLSCFFVLLQISPVGAEIVQCIGTDGHTEIEISRLGNCFACVDDSSHDDSLERTDGDHCGICIDIPLNSPFPSSNGPRPFFTPTLPLNPPAILKRDLNLGLSRHFQIIPLAFIQLKRTVVLLI